MYLAWQQKVLEMCPQLEARWGAAALMSNEDDIFLHARNAYERLMQGASGDAAEAEMQHFVDSLQRRVCARLGACLVA